jgi:hypothetical protein
VPTISRFFGIVITMYYRDHAPPHFHARYGEHDAEIGIEDSRVMEGALPPRALRLVVEWAALHRDELRENWASAREERPLKPIAPLE